MRIGLTGGIASGKSTVAAYLAQLGAHIIDADVLGHRAYDPGTRGFQRVVETFGAELVGVDGRIDRKALGGVVFGAPERLAQLTDIVWPEILAMAEADMAAVAERDPQRIIVLEAAVLLEAGWDAVVDEVWAVVVAPEVAKQRATARDGVGPEVVQRRIDAQMSNDERRARAHVVIDNSRDTETLLALVDREWLRLTGNDGRQPRELAS